MPISVLAQSYGKTGESSNFNGDVGVPSGSGYYINGVQITSGALSDVASIAMLDEAEIVTVAWDFATDVTIFIEEDDLCPTITFKRARDGDPTYDISSGDILGAIKFDGRSGAVHYEGVAIRAILDGTPGVNDMPGRLEFLTSADGSSDPTLRMAIDQAGNIKMGDGAWTNYVNVTAGGVLTFEGTASINEPLSILAATTSAELAGVISDETGSGKLVYDTSPTLVTPTLGVASATSISLGDEALDTYDEGTFTPTIYGSTTAGTQSYTTQTGLYTRFGRLVHGVMAVVLSSTSGAAGNIYIGGLPFTADATAIRVRVEISDTDNLTGYTQATTLGSFVIYNSTNIAVADNNGTLIGVGALTATTGIYLTFLYIVQ